MPQVPILSGPSVRDAPLQGGFQHDVDVTGGLRSLGVGLGATADVVEKTVQRQDNDIALSTDARVKTGFMQFDAELRKKSQGQNAVGYAEKVNAWWQEQAKSVGENLTNNQKALIGRSLSAAQLQSGQAALTWQNGELERSETDSFNAAQIAEIQRGVAGGPAVATTSMDLLKARNAQRAQQKGLTPEVLAEMNLKATTALNVNLLQDMQQKDPTAALAYFNANKGDIDPTRHAEIEHSLTTASAGIDGMKTSGDIWEKLGPKADGQAVELDKMEAAAREKYPNDPIRLQATIAQLKERAAAQNTAERERSASNVNTVMLAYSKGTAVSQLMMMPAFTALPGSEQAKIKAHIEDRNYAMMLRGNAADARVDAAEARAQRKLARDGYAAYLTYGNPATLAGMSENEVQALLPSLGNELTGHLLERKRAMVKSPLGESEARMDNDDFNHAAQTMGLKPFEKKSDEEKAALGEVKYRVEQLIYQAQQSKKAPLTRAEKTELMTQELARTVKVDGGWFSSNKDVPVVGLNKDDIKDVIVPQAARAQIADAMKQMFTRTQNPLYAPTDTNMRRFYLMSKSRAANLLPQDPNAK
jgi:hypothetical protein